MRDRAPEAGAELGDVDTVGERYDRLVGGDDRQQHHLLVQHLVVLQLMEQRRRRSFRILSHEDCRSADTHRRVEPQAREELIEPHPHLGELAHAPARAESPRRHHAEDRQRGDHREPPAVEDLGEIGGEERDVDDEKEADEHARAHPRPLPLPPCDDVEEDGRDAHRAGDGDAVRRREA